MPSLTIKNVPPLLLDRLRRRAAANRRSLSHEVIAALETTVSATQVDADSLLARARAVRIVPRGRRLDDRTLRAFRAAGRP